MKITTNMPDPMRLLAWALLSLVAVGGYIWRGEVEKREKLEQAIQAEHEAVSQLRTQVLVMGTGSQGTAQRINELSDEFKQLRRELRPLIEVSEERNSRGRRRE